jgi:hypothetical protein
MGNIQQSVIRFDPNACAGFSAPPRTGRATDDRVLARHDRISPIEFLAARYPVIRRLVGELAPCRSTSLYPQRTARCADSS